MISRVLLKSMRNLPKVRCGGLERRQCLSLAVASLFYDKPQTKVAHHSFAKILKYDIARLSSGAQANGIAVATVSGAIFNIKNNPG